MSVSIGVWMTASRAGKQACEGTTLPWRRQHGARTAAEPQRPRHAALMAGLPQLPVVPALLLRLKLFCPLVSQPISFQ